MGDKPILSPFPNACPLGPWLNGREPNSITTFISGVQKGAAWSEGVAVPPEGMFVLPFQSCGVYSMDDGHFLHRLNVFEASAVYSVDVFNTGLPFIWHGLPADPLTGTNENVNTEFLWYGGSFFADLNFEGFELPDSWDASAALVIPTSSLQSNPNPHRWSGYFAEELPTNLAARKLRYARHGDGTNLKVFMNQ